MATIHPHHDNDDDDDEEEETPWIEDADADSDDDANSPKDNNDSDDDDDSEQPYGGLDLFSTDHRDPTDIFTVTLSPNNNNNHHPEMSIRLTGIKAKYPHLLQSTGMTLWKGSQHLCDFLVENPAIVRHKSVVELGAGLGLCGIVAHLLGAAKVIMTDGDTDTLANLRRNVQLNQKHPHPSQQEGQPQPSKNNSDPPSSTLLVKQLLWGQKVENFRQKYTGERGFQVVMGGDIAYAQEALDILLQTVVQLLAHDHHARFILSFAFRGGVSIQNVMDCACNNHALICCQEPVDKGPDGDGVYVFCRTREEESNEND